MILLNSMCFLLNKSNRPFLQIDSYWGVTKQLCKEQGIKLNKSQWRENNILYSSKDIPGIEIKKKKGMKKIA